MSQYPYPCDKCTHPKCGTPANAVHFRHCEAWLKWWRWWWKRFNSYGNRKLTKRESFAYLHPDDVRRFLRVSPCESCPGKDTCDIPCRQYLIWYDARMAMLRKKVGL